MIGDGDDIVCVVPPPLDTIVDRLDCVRPGLCLGDLLMEIKKKNRTGQHIKYLANNINKLSKMMKSSSEYGPIHLYNNDNLKNYAIQILINFL